MDYTLSPARRARVVDALHEWLADEQLDRVCVEAITGRGGTAGQNQLESMDRDLLDRLGSPDAILDETLENHAERGGKLRLRAVFKDGDGKETSRRRELQLVRAGGANSSGGAGTGGDRATALIARSMASALDSQGRRTDSSHELAVKTLMDSGQLVNGIQEQRLVDLLTMADKLNTAQLQAMKAELQLEFERAQGKSGFFGAIGEALAENPELLGSMTKAIGPGIVMIGTALQQLAAGMVKRWELDEGEGVDDEEADELDERLARLEAMVAKLVVAQAAPEAGDGAAPTA